ncbi:hypothetical protein SAY87_001410 [Trapa incisa]|uniref:Uncharacterized protein n=1 Tax=Trapa incisa TaxID=236973 RepID=A0AAN7JGY0_9MYRT|nr:hypothetical protein SAY87_001410 [Trapa incisa]
MENVEIAKWVPVPSGITSTSEDYRAQNVIDEFFQPRKKQATVWSSGFGSAVGYYLYLMENVLDDESQKKVLQALEEADVFTSGGLMKAQRMDDHPLSDSSSPSGILRQPPKILSHLAVKFSSLFA